MKAANNLLWNFDNASQKNYLPSWGDESRSLQLHTLHQQPWLKGPDLHVTREDSYDVWRLVFWEILKKARRWNCCVFQSKKVKCGSERMNNNNNKKPKWMFNLFEKEQFFGKKIIHKWIIFIVVYLQYLDWENAAEKERGAICIKSPQLEEKKKQRHWTYVAQDVTIWLQGQSQK